MKKTYYSIVKEKYFFDNNSRISYGIAAFAGVEPEDILTIIATVNDITCDKEKVVALVKKCNDMSLSLMHLNDVVTDFLAE